MEEAPKNFSNLQLLPQKKIFKIKINIIHQTIDYVTKKTKSVNHIIN